MISSQKQTFPFIFGRTGGGSLSILDSFITKVSNACFEELFVFQADIDKLKNNLVDQLHSIINLEKDEKLKISLIGLKRDIFNERDISKYSEIPLYADLNNKINSYLRQRADLENLKKSYRSLFFQEFYESIESLKEISETFFFKNGLLFSSKILYAETQKKGFGNTSINKYNKRIILSNLKYLSRSITKTTPFSSFNSIYCLEYKDNNFFPIKESFKVSNFQITNLFFHHLKEVLLNRTDFKNALIIKTNSTIWEEDIQENTFHFFVNKANNESFKKINKSVVSLIYEQLKHNYEYAVFIKNLQKQFNEEKKQVEKFVDTLIDEGFLKLAYPVSNNDKNWVSKLLDFLDLNNLWTDKQLVDIVNLLEDVIKTIDALEKTFNVDDRKNLIDKFHEKTSNFFTGFNRMKNLQPQDLFYEDFLVSVQDVIEIKKCTDLSNALSEVFSILNIPLKKLLKKELSNYLTNDNLDKFPILLFYEKIYLKHKESFVLENVHLNSSKVLSDKIIGLIEQRKDEFNEAIDISKFAEKESVQKTEGESFGVYIQTTGNSFDKVVINSFSNGNGANVSRFLNFLPDEHSVKILEYNKQLHTDKITAEIKDASIHNTNTFPKLADYLINISEDNALNKYFNTIPLSEIYVAVRNENDLILVNNEGTEINAINFSMEGLNRRSKFTQFLDIFNKTDTFGYVFFIGSINEYFKKKADTQNIIMMPRITYGEKVIIQRKKWLVNRHFISSSTETNGDALDEVYFKANHFISKYGIPNEVFIKITNQKSSNAQDDNYKPQYINFHSPVFVMLFMNLLSKADDVIEITEMFPTSKDVIKNKGKVKEYILNVN